MIRGIINFINLFIYKKNRVVISVFPNFEDNGVALAKYIAANYNIQIYFINPTNKYSKFINETLNIEVLQSKTLKSIYLILTSKFVFFTHGLVLKRISKRQIVFNLWHGYPYKSVGTYLNGKGINATYTAATSDYCQVLFSKMFDVPFDSVEITGFPRNDNLIIGNRNEILSKFKIAGNKFIFIWLPTYRRSVIGEIMNDGVETGNPFSIKDFDIYKFNKFLEKNNAVCILKPHPLAPKFSSVKEINNIVFIDDDFLHDNEMTLYPLLGVTDCLISDVSSVIIDYMLLDKPIICFIEDIIEYKKSRGLVFDNFEEMIPGSVAYNIDDFYGILDKLFTENDLLPDKRRDLESFFHKYKDFNSSKRVSDIVFKNFKFEK
ncbi:MAG: CDP-glycerol glycerophosphotransferase family protein [Flavobacteriaceae bacterium]|nr:CDP-glycerol glycerophosphotransferase family protein [Flavobacteriaceae bacterium]